MAGGLTPKEAIFMAQDVFCGLHTAYTGSLFPFSY